MEGQDIFHASSYTLDSHSKFPVLEEREVRPPSSVPPLRVQTPLGLSAQRRLNADAQRRLQPLHLGAVSARERLQNPPAHPTRNPWGRLPTPADTRYARVTASMRWPIDNSAERGFKYTTASPLQLHGRLHTVRHGNLYDKPPWENRRLGLDFGHGDPSRRGIM